MFWIADQAEKAILNEESQPKLPNGRPKPFRLDKYGALVDDRSTYSMLSSIGADTFEQRCNVPVRGGSEDRRRNINYLLSVFEPSGQLPSEFHNQERQTHPDRKSQAYQELRDLIMARIVNDNELYQNLKSIISPGLYANTIFQKLSKRANETFRSLDEYIKNGGAGDEPACDVVTCGQRLEEIVREISSNVHIFYQGESLPEAERSATFALIKILNAVVKRDYDAYENVTWHRVQDQSEPIENRNLYALLIANRSPRAVPFLLPALAKLPQRIIRVYKNEIDSCVNLIEQSSKPNPQYLAQLRSLRA